MSSPTSSSSAASESSRSSSPDTGATTPSSVFGGSSILSLPSIYVYFVGTSFTASTLEETFKKHASDNCMGVIIDQNSVDRDSQFFSCKGEWMPLSTSNGNGGSTLNYFSTTVKLEDHVLPVSLIYHIICCLPPPDPVSSTDHSFRIHKSFTSKWRKYFLSMWSSLHIFSPLDNIFDPSRFRKISLCLSTSLVHYYQ